jgi:fluoride exporter
VSGPGDPDGEPELPIDSDLPFPAHGSSQAQATGGPLGRDDTSVWSRRDVIAAIAAGGAIGAVARYALERALPTGSADFPWATFLTNMSGSLILGMLLVVLVERYPDSRYARPFLGTGVLGAYTTFSTYTVETADLTRQGHAGLAATYLLGSLVLGLLCAWLGIAGGGLLCRLGNTEHRTGPDHHTGKQR